MHCLGNVAFSTDDYESALSWYHQSLEMSKRIHGDNADHRSISSSLHNIGLDAQSKGDIDDALKWCQSITANREEVVRE